VSRVRSRRAAQDGCANRHALDLFVIGIILCSADKQSEDEAISRADLTFVRARGQLLGRTGHGLGDYLERREEAIRVMTSLVEELDACRSARRARQR
jgi:hypothetical protein